MGAEVQQSNVPLLPHRLFRYFAAASFDLFLLLLSNPIANEALNFTLL